MQGDGRSPSRSACLPVIHPEDAQRTLGRSTAYLTYSMLKYTTILQAFVRSGESPLFPYPLRPTNDFCSIGLPANSKYRSSQAAVKRVERELIHRERKMQAEIIEIAPLMV